MSRDTFFFARKQLSRVDIISDIISRFIEGDKNMISEVTDISNGNIAFMNIIGKHIAQAKIRGKTTMPRQEYIYAVHSEAFQSSVKIGRTKNITTRLCGLNCSMPEKPYKLYARFATYNAKKDEAETHNTFHQFHVVNEHYSAPLDTISAYFEMKHAEHLEKRGAIKSRVHLSRAFFKWKKKSNVPEREQVALASYPSEIMTDLDSHKRKREPEEESEEDSDFKNMIEDCYGRELTERDICDLHAIKNCSSMRMNLMVRGMKVMDKLNPCWKEEDPDLMEEIYHSIASLVNCRCNSKHSFIQFSLSVQMMILKDNEMELETVIQAINLMESLETEKTPNWKVSHPDLVEKIKSTLIYNVMGVTFPQLSCPTR